MTQDFNDFGLPAKLLQCIARMGFSEPTPIQEQAIPLALSGKDILGSAQTGTGKTGAFGIPLIAKLMEDDQATALVMTPTRELACQVAEALQQMIPVANIKVAVLIGGEPMPKQFRQLSQNPRLIVGTPGRINDHLERKSVNLSKTRYLVLDETDRMLDMGFGIQIDQILTHVPKERQTMLFSATLPPTIVKLSTKYANNAVRIAVGQTTTPVAKIHQELIRTSDVEKYSKLLEQLKQRTGSVIIFVKTRFGTEKLATKLNNSGQVAEAIHGDLQQRRRDRVIKGFREKNYRILVATDVAARGLDIPHIEHVVNYDLPQCPEDYIHRIGRTARAGAKGEAINFLTPADESKWRAIHRLLDGHEDAGSQSGYGKKGYGSRPSGRPTGPKIFKKPYHDNRRGGDGEAHTDRQPRTQEAAVSGDAPHSRAPFKKPYYESRHNDGSDAKTERHPRSQEAAVSSDAPRPRAPFKKPYRDDNRRPEGGERTEHQPRKHYEASNSNEASPARPFHKKPYRDENRRPNDSDARPERQDRPARTHEAATAGDPFRPRAPFKKPYREDTRRSEGSERSAPRSAEGDAPRSSAPRSGERPAHAGQEKRPSWKNKQRTDGSAPPKRAGAFHAKPGFKSKPQKQRA